jgi:hypothetical protein
MHQWIELSNEQVKDYEWVNPNRRKQMLIVGGFSSKNFHYFCDTIDSRGFCIKISNKNWIEKKENKSNDN